MHHRNVWICAFAVFIALIAILACMNAAVKKRAEQQPHGRFTNREILTRIQLMQTLSLLSASAIPSPSKLNVYSAQGEVKRFWNVECSDVNGTSDGIVQWDAESGRLCLLSRNSSPSHFSAPDMTRAQATARAWLFLRQPGFGIPEGPWQMADAPQLSGNLWRIQLKSSREAAMLIIDKHTGQITYARF